MIVDASALVDIFIKSRERHQYGCQLASYIKKHKVQVIVPTYAILEVKCAVDNERMVSKRGEVSKTFSESEPLNMKMINIDQKFLREYLDLGIPYIKAGDLIYILIAKKHDGILITEDVRQAKVARSINVETYKIDEFLNKFDDVVSGKKIYG